MKRVTILALDDALATSITIPLEMLNAANVIARVRRAETDLLIETAGVRDEPVTVTGGMEIMPRSSITQIQQSDLIFVPALWGSPARALRRHPEPVDWLREQYQAGATVCSVCTGSYFLAEAGLLDGRVATTHWYYFDDFANRYPAIKLERKRFITHDTRLYCTGSVNAARDLMLHFIENLYGDAIANEVSRHFTHELKRSWESLLLNHDQQNTHHDETIIKAQEWLQMNFQRDIQIEEMAATLKLSVRSLNRRFKTATNRTPLQYLQEVRIEEARELLKQSNLAVAEIAFRVGYHDASHFAGLFRRLNKVTPVAYRRLVRNKVFNVESAES
ncbi:MAG: GlxA family transcriptional regulator [Pseudohongiellaceae bacterium]